jgi:hypothetical protein
MDNFNLDVTCEGATALRLVVDLAFTQHCRVTHYAIREPEPALTEPEYSKRPAKPKRLVFMWTNGGRDAVKLPFELDAEGERTGETKYHNASFAFAGQRVGHGRAA